MKNLLKLFGIIALVAVIGFSMTACGGDGGDDGGGKIDPTVTWPTGLTATVGQTLSEVTIPAHTGTTPGSFSWTTPTVSVGEAGSRSHNMTFTPIDNTTYNTITQNVTITVKSVEFDFNEYDGTIIKYNGDGGNVIIPSEINGVAVTYIGDLAFSEYFGTGGPGGGSYFAGKGVTSVTIPNSVVKIGSHAFRGNLLTSVNIPDSVTTIGMYAFSDNQLTSIAFGNSLITIGSYAFAGNQLTSVVFPSSLETINLGAFYEQLTEFTIGGFVDMGVSGSGDDLGIPYFNSNTNDGAGKYTRPDIESRTWTKQN